MYVIKIPCNLVPHFQNSGYYYGLPLKYLLLKLQFGEKVAFGYLPMTQSPPQPCPSSCNNEMVVVRSTCLFENTIIFFIQEP